MATGDPDRPPRRVRWVVALVATVVVLGGGGWWLGSRLVQGVGRLIAPPGASTPAHECTAPALGAAPRGCEAVWVHPVSQGRIVPQGLALGPGGTAFISGYRWGPVGDRPCRLYVVDRRTGRVRHAFEDLTGLDSAGAEVPCRHGGGLTAGPEGLWLADPVSIRLLDPEALRRGELVIRRVWHLRPPVKASSIVRHGESVGIVAWSRLGEDHVDWVDVADLTAPAVTTVSRRSGPGVLVPRQRTSAPQWVQGATSGPRGVWFTASTTYCGILHRPDGRRVPFVPGAEGLVIDGGSVWVVSESGARHYRREGGRPLVPTLIRLPMSALDPDLPTGCSWDS